MRAVLTGEDCRVPYGVMPIAQNEYPLARERVRYRGEPVAAVAAMDEATARRGDRAIELDIPAAAGLFQRQGCARAGRRGAARGQAGNIEREVDQAFGDAQAGFAAADLVRERSFHYAEVLTGRSSSTRAVAE